MNAIIGLTQLALRTKPSPKMHDYLSKVRASSKSLLRIINDIMDLSKLEVGKLDLELVDFDLRDVMSDLLNMLGETATTKGLEFLVSVDRQVPCGLKGDPLRLGQVLTNLTNNAIKFTHEGEILVKVSLVRTNPERATLNFSVKDSGIGIDQNTILKLFDPFTQADGSTTRRYGGSGLGLTICKRLVEMMGGKIQVESEPGKGSTFSFALDFDLWKEARETPASHDLGNLKVLVVDDNQMAREVLKEILDVFSFEVRTVDSGEKALKEIFEANATKPYDLILMDWNMPGMDGIETSKRIDRDPRADVRIPKIIMVTAYGREEVMQQSEEAGLDGFLLKPVHPSLMLDTILRVFGKEPPTRELATGISSEEDAAAEKIRGAQVLVVEDNEINRQIAREILEGAGIAAQLASNGVEAVKAVSESDFDLVLMDIQMPEMDGYEATRKIRTDPKHKDLPIVAMTAHALKGDREKCLEAGMNDHVTKPIDIKELVVTLATWIKPGIRRVPFQIVQQRPTESVEIPAIPDSLPGIDIKSALKRLGGNERLFKKLLGDFHRDFQQITEDTRHAWAQGDMETSRRLAHTIKGVSGNIGAKELHIASREVEAAIVQGDEDEFQRSLDMFDDALKQVLESISGLEEKKEGATLHKAETQPLDGAKIEPLLMELSGLLRRSDFRALECLEFLKAELKDSANQEDFLNLEASVGGFDFNAAHEALEKLALALNTSLSGS